MGTELADRYHIAPSTMDAQERARLFEQSLQAFRRGDSELASRGFRRLLKDGSKDPRHASYCGLALATVEGKHGDGKRLCEFAVKEAFYDPEMHLNLALVYEHGGRRTQAILSLLQGLRIDPNDVRLRKEYRRLDRRAKPILSFLRRNHPINRLGGSIRARFSATRP